MKLLYSIKWHPQTSNQQPKKFWLVDKPSNHYQQSEIVYITFIHQNPTTGLEKSHGPFGSTGTTSYMMVETFSFTHKNFITLFKILYTKGAKDCQLYPYPTNHYVWITAAQYQQKSYRKRELASRYVDCVRENYRTQSIYMKITQSIVL